MGAIPWYGDDRRLPCGQQALSFSSGLATANLGPVRPGGDLTGLFTPFCESSSFVEDPCRDAIATLALEEKGAVQRSSIPPYQGGRGVYPVVAGPGRGGGGIYSYYFLATKRTRGSWTQHVPLCFKVPHGDTQFYYSGFTSGLVDSVAGSQGCLSACADTSISLAVPSVCSQEFGERTHFFTNGKFFLLA